MPGIAASIFAASAAMLKGSSPISSGASVSVMIRASSSPDGLQQVATSPSPVMPPGVVWLSAVNHGIRQNGPGNGGRLRRGVLTGDEDEGVNAGDAVRHAVRLVLQIMGKG